MIRNGKTLAGIGGILLLLLLPACSQEETPQHAFEAYVNGWQALNYEAMYDKLSPASQTKISKDDFVKKYESVYKGIEMTDLTVKPAFPEELQKPVKNKDEVSVPFHVELNTLAGPVKFDQTARLVKGKKEKDTVWQIDWSPSYLFPQLKDGDKVRVQSTEAVRGEIVDRRGNKLAYNGPAKQIGVVPGKLGDAAEQTKAKLANKLGMKVEEINQKLAASWVKPESFVPLAYIQDGETEAYTKLPGVTFSSKEIRTYPFDEAAAHLTGYIGQISAEELKKLQSEGYRTGDMIGKAGLEQIYEKRLKGQPGSKIFITGADGTEKETLAEKVMVPGQTVTLSIDANLQKLVYEQMKKDAGSAAAIQPLTGEVLALVSSPSYNPNVFVKGISGTQYKQLSEDPKKPFLNRFTKTFSPGSAFKMLTAAVAIDGGVLNPDDQKPIKGLRWTKDASWGSYYVTRVHDSSPVNLQSALTNSDNIYFAQAALELGKDKFVEASAKFGINEKLPLPYAFDSSQLYNKQIANDIQLADSGYGQGEVTMTSLHTALTYSALVNQGNIIYPSLLKEDKVKEKYWKPSAMKPETAELLKKDLVEAVKDPRGVGHGAAVPGKLIAGKTGTAELKKAKGEEGQENGWFVGFDAADPQLLVSMMIEDVKGRGGSGYITSRVKAVFQQYANGIN
ncbi:penicillin-binding transpeptidase domain-containing protein [Paenibacillus chitinolyticus]|uniref:penicillin-binding transpeptidase domain-containing protein n=1 Tax=Paenibacillus chitinolyticus TaxID=79263 RepID=UPI0036D7703A